jgi:hypothetical protein
MSTPWGAVLGTVAGIADDLITTDKERLELALEDKKLDTGLLQGQIDTNKAEAAHPSIFVAGWRPFAGWVCGASLAFVYLPKAVVMTTVWAYQCWLLLELWQPPAPAPVLPVFPDLGVTDLIGLLMALLGLAGIRSYDKRADTDTKRTG